ncbi:MAG: gamma-glutamylcyclotransferase family protein [Acetobacteraceae bacterium]|nr:gamma-glutamylcyclotransferase [Pseudomonadota bacterium]
MAVELVFVYGSLKRGYRNHGAMSGCRFVGEGRTQPAFAMIDLGPYPGVIRGKTIIGGEVFAVPSHRMGRLDRLEDNGRVYQRERARIDLPAGPTEAWIYLYLLARGLERPVLPRDGMVIWRENPALRT